LLFPIHDPGLATTGKVIWKTHETATPSGNRHFQRPGYGLSHYRSDNVPIVTRLNHGTDVRTSLEKTGHDADGYRHRESPSS
ncbi:hypothetical protein, partial [Methanospirillum sp.]|uniref:hypothetical protein n=1 Tax=Methanospirillum sp. TaxID=45200 RepID=UPI002D1FAF40